MVHFKWITLNSVEQLPMESIVNVMDWKIMCEINSNKLSARREWRFSFVPIMMRVVNITSIVKTQLRLEFIRVDKEVIKRTLTFKLVEIFMLLFILIVALILKRIIFSFLLKQQRSMYLRSKCLWMITHKIHWYLDIKTLSTYSLWSFKWRNCLK